MIYGTGGISTRNPIIEKVAAQHGISYWKCKRAIEEGITLAWLRSKVDPEVRENWKKYFPDGRKPSVDEFLLTIDLVLKEKHPKI